VVRFLESANLEEKSCTMYQVNRQEAAARRNMKNIQTDKNHITLLGTHK
jgi:hypothetical protein